MRRIVLFFLPRTVRFQGYQLVLNREDHVMGSALLRGYYEPYGIKLFRESLSPGMVVVDCGANVGIYTCLAAGAVGRQGKVYAFEPEPRNFNCLAETIRLNGFENVAAERLALSDQNGETNLFLSDINMGDHRLGGSDEKRQSVRIATRTLDSYWDGMIPEIDVLKMDVQGAEGLVLRGMRETILKSKRLKIFIEFWPYGLIRCGTNPRDLIEELKGYGFSIQIVNQDQKSLLPLKAVEDLLMNDSEETSFDLFLER